MNTTKILSALTVAFGLASIGQARADFAITQAGLDQGLSVTTFASGFPSRESGSGPAGPLGVGFIPGGGVLVSDFFGDIRRFATDADGQSAAGAPIVQSFGFSNSHDIAQVGGGIYLTRPAIGDLAQLNNDGTLNQVVVSGLPSAVGVVANPTNGHLFVATSGTIYDVDPTARTKTSFIDRNADGLSISGDGRTLYGAVGGHILGFDTTTKLQVFDSGSIGGVDGTAIGTGLFAGYAFANTNFGQLYEVNLTTKALTLIGTGGSRGDFVTVDPTDDTLLITQSDRILRIHGASFAIPEPSSVVLLALGAVGLAASGRRYARRA